MLEAFCTSWLLRDFHVDFCYTFCKEKDYFAEQCCFEIHLFVLFGFFFFFFSYLQLVNGPFCGCFCIYIVFVDLLAMGTTKNTVHPATLILFYSMCTNKLYRC